MFKKIQIFLSQLFQRNPKVAPKFVTVKGENKKPIVLLPNDGVSDNQLPDEPGEGAKEEKQIKSKGRNGIGEKNVQNPKVSNFPTRLSPGPYGWLDKKIINSQPIILPVVDNMTAKNLKSLNVVYWNKYNLFNHSYHLTQHYHGTESSLIVRRGALFKISLTFDRRVYQSDKIVLVFRVSDIKYPNYDDGAAVKVELTTDTDITDPMLWGARIIKISGNSKIFGNQLTITIMTAADCIVAKWQLDILTCLNGGNLNKFTIPAPIFILFNAWCKFDEVFMEDASSRGEYILSNYSAYYHGSPYNILMSPWSVDLYEEHVLDCAMEIIYKVAKLPPAKRGSAIFISRALSSAVNANLNGGILAGDWSNDNALMYSGSAEIIVPYYTTKIPTKYGQCWVFASVLNTCNRTLGIPSRVVTNFQCAFDDYRCLLVKTVFEGERIVKNPVIWNFHIWNDVYMKRRDLSFKGYFDGWQAVDSTPQELSDRLYQCGPCPLKCIKYGLIYMLYDAFFLYHAVNADYMTLENFPDKKLKMINIFTDYIGMNISTKETNSLKRFDITDLYKFKEGSDKERYIMKNALLRTGNEKSLEYLDNGFEKKFPSNIKLDFDDIVYGQKFNSKLTFRNNDDEHIIDVEVLFKIYKSLCGVKIKLLKAYKFNMKIAESSSAYKNISLDYNEYETEFYRNYESFHVIAIAKVLETDKKYIIRGSYSLKYPEIQMYLDRRTDRTQEIFVVNVEYTNILPMQLKNCKIYIKSYKMENPIILDAGTIEVNKTFRTSFKFQRTAEYDVLLFAQLKSSKYNKSNGHVVIPGK